MSNKTIDEALNTTFDIGVPGVVASIPEYLKQAITQAMLDAVPIKIEWTKEEMLKEGKDQRLLASYIGFNDAIDQMESAIKKRGSDE